jgi:hypothetical protein
MRKYWYRNNCVCVCVFANKFLDQWVRVFAAMKKYIWYQYCAAVVFGFVLALWVPIAMPDLEVMRCGNETVAESVRALHACYGSGRTLNVTETRDLYNCLLTGGNWQRVQTKYVDSEICHKAKKLHGYRHAVRLYTRTRGPFVAQLLAQMRDFFVYRNSEGPLFSDLLGRSGGNCSTIIHKATRTNTMYNTLGSDSLMCDT